MISKVLVLFSMLSFLCPCCGDEKSTQETLHQDIPLEPEDTSSQANLNNSSDFWRFWRAWKFWKMGESLLNNEFPRSYKLESATERQQGYFNRPSRPRIKNKVKLLIKINQYEI